MDKRKLRNKHINHVLRLLESAFDESDTLKEWEDKSYSIYVTHFSYDYDTFLKLKKYVC